MTFIQVPDGWIAEQKSPSHCVHVFPVRDVIKHETRNCVCGPCYRFQHTDTGICGIITHHAVQTPEIQRDTTTQ